MRTRVAGALALALVLVAMSADFAFSQVALPENHYKVYVSSPITLVKPVDLSDQFGSFSVLDMVFDKFSTPVEKRHSDGTVSPIYNPDIHMDWWRIFSPQPIRTIIGMDQFGTAQWVVKDARYLLVPSLKNWPVPPIPTVPLWNHYVCYEALSGPLVGQPVVLFDQFGNAQVHVLQAKFFCNPAQKRADGQIYPILDATVHLACYVVNNPDFNIHPITTVDQFGYWQTQIYNNDCLCVPALKDHPVRTEQSTWGRVKALYR